MWTNEIVTCTQLMNFNINTTIAKKYQEKTLFLIKYIYGSFSFCMQFGNRKKKPTKIRHLKR